MDIIVFLLLIVGMAFIIVSWVRSDLKCPPPKIVYRYIQGVPLDTQFGEDNQPSEIFKDMFTKSSPWIGGFGLGNKAFATEMNIVDKNSKDQTNLKTRR